MVNTENRRSVDRIPCRIKVSQTENHQLLGEIRNLSLGGVFIGCDDPLPEGKTLSICFEAGKNNQKIVAYSEVVHRSDNGVGVRFIHLSPGDKRTLRRYVVEMSSLLGHRETTLRLHDLEGKTVAPIKDTSRIGELFEGAISEAVKVTIISAERSIREEVYLREASDDHLSLKWAHATGSNATEFVDDEMVFGWLTIDYVSYSFRSRVVDRQDDMFRLQTPTEIHFSERRGDSRKRASDGKLLRLSLPWLENDGFKEWPVLDESPGGLSFIVDPESIVLLPGTPLRNATIVEKGHDGEGHYREGHDGEGHDGEGHDGMGHDGESHNRKEHRGESFGLKEAVVKHVTLLREDNKPPRLKIGVAHGVRRSKTITTQSSLGQEQRIGLLNGVLQRIRDQIKGQWVKASYLFHKFKEKSTDSERDHFRVVFPNKEGKKVVGLLDLAFPPEESSSSPLVIVTPGYGGRKEVMSGLAATIVHNFRRRHRQVAVLRIDNTNNLGESEKDPGCEKDGTNNLHYTLSGGVADLLGAVEWANDNPHFYPSDIVVISISLSSVSVRRALTIPEAHQIILWIAFMGVADAQDAALHASGNIDMYGNYMRGVKNGVVSLLGCLVDADHYCADLEKHGLATLEDARNDMSKITADILWIVGKHDGWLNPERVYDVMSVKADGKREVLEVDAGHVPRSSKEALAEFALMTRRIWRYLYTGEDLDVDIPSEGFLAHIARKEWARVRSNNPLVGEDYWKRYLLGDEGIGFDIVELAPPYKQFVKEQVDLLQPKGKRVLELGAGTGNVSYHLWQEEPASLCCMDLVKDALRRLEEKIGQDDRITTLAADLDGGPRTAVRRWLAGELPNALDLAGRIPGLSEARFRPICQKYGADLHGYLRGAFIDVEKAFKGADLRRDMPAVLHDINLLAQVERGLVPEEDAPKRLKKISPEVLKNRVGLPFEDKSYDCVMASLFLSYLRYPEDILSEIHRVLRKGGTLVISSMIPDADISKLVLQLIDQITEAPEEELPEGYGRRQLLKMGRDYISAAADLVRFEEEGQFQFYNADQLVKMLERTGFIESEAFESFGTPAQAVIVRCRKP